MRVRERGPITVPLPIYTGVSYTSPYANGVWGSPYYHWKFTGYPVGTVAQTARSVCHDELHPGPPYKTGGPFNKWEYFADQYQPKGWVDTISPDQRYRYIGRWLPPVSCTNYIGYTSLNDYKTSDVGNAFAHGATGWNLYRPTRPSVNLGESLGELQDLPRMLKTSAKGFHDTWRSMRGSRTSFGPKKVADHWLNTQFGWLPFLSDLRGLYKTTRQLHWKLKRLRQYNGKWEKRGGTFDTDTTQSVPSHVTNTVGLWPSPAGVLNVSGGERKYTLTTSRRVWFVARFRYYIPGKPGSWQWTARAVALLYGLQPSPSLIWELTPWSWLIDWWSNVGDVIANLSSSVLDNLAAKYAYVMRKSVTRVDFYGSNLLLDGRRMHGSWSAEYTRKSRAGASPFGFGLAWGDLTARQLSILAALGLSRLG